MPPHLRIGRDQTVANFGASHKQHMTPGRSFGHFFHLQAPACPLPTTASRRRCPWAPAPYGQPRYRSATFPTVQNDLRAPPAQRDDGDRHALPGRHRRSQAATTPAVVAAWQSARAHLPTMASVCRAPDAPALQQTARTTLPNVCELRNSTFAITRDATNKPVSRNSKTPIYQLKYCINRSTVIK